MHINYLSEIQTFMEFLTKLPQNFLDMIMGSQVSYYDYKERIQKQKEIVELREIAKSLQKIYFVKGDIISFAQNIREGENENNIQYMIEDLKIVIEGLKGIKENILQTSFSNTELATKASYHISIAANAYESLSQISPRILSKDGTPIQIYQSLEKIRETGNIFITELDKHRKQLEQCY